MAVSVHRGCSWGGRETILSPVFGECLWFQLPILVNLGFHLLAFSPPTPVSWIFESLVLLHIGISCAWHSANAQSWVCIHLCHQSPFSEPFLRTSVKFLNCERVFWRYYLHCEFKYFLLLYNCRNWEDRVWRCHAQKVPLLFNCPSSGKPVSISLPQFFNL